MQRSRKLVLTEWTKANDALNQYFEGNKSKLTVHVKMSRTTVTAFFKQQPVREAEFRKLCLALRLNWQEVSSVQAPPPQSESKTELFQQVREHCRQEIPNQHSRMRLLSGKESKVDQLYVDVRVPNQLPASDPIKCDRYALRQLPYQNLPLQTNEFIGRISELRQLLEQIDLDYRAPYITVDGIGGVGKTALVIEAAYRCWEYKHSASSLETPLFDAIVFTTAKENKLLPGGIISELQRQSTLRDIFYEIAHTLDDQSITQATPDEQLHRVRDSLSRQKTLLIVDNLETIENQNNVLAFLDNLPLSTKAIITTRDVVSRYSSLCLNELPKDDSMRLIQQQATQKGLNLSEETFEALYRRFGGVPVALIYGVGMVSSRYPLDILLDKSTPLPEDVAHFCFESSVQPLREKSAHKLLMSLAIFSQPPVREALAEVAGLTADPIAVNKGLAKLLQLSLIRQTNERYEMLTLTREYALAELAGYRDFEEEARERWVDWHLSFAEKYGGEDWGEWYAQYSHLEKERENLLTVLHWLAIQERYVQALSLWSHLDNYIDICGYWEERIFWLNWIVKESKQRRDWQTYVESMSNKGWTLSMTGKYENWQEADKILTLAWDFRNYASYEVQSCLAKNMAVRKTQEKDYENARQLLKTQRDLLGKTSLEGKKVARALSMSFYYCAETYYFESNYDQARHFFEKTIEITKRIGWQRFNNYASNWLCEIEILQGNLDKAENTLNNEIKVAESNLEQRRIAHLQVTYSRLAKARGNLEEAIQRANIALDGFKHLGMTKDADEVRKLIIDLSLKSTND